MQGQMRSRVEEGRFVSIHGVDQWVTVRGQDQGNPVLLILPGPGAGMCVLAPFFAPWEQAFTLLQWDQPRAGVTHAHHGGNTPGEYTVDRLARDGVAVCEWARQQLGGKRIAVVGFSGGTIVGLHMVKRRADLFSAYVGTGQIANWARQDELSYQLVLEQARCRRDALAIADLERIGPPPYRDTATDAIKSKYAVAPTPAEAPAFASLLALMSDPPRDAGYVPANSLPEKDGRAVSTAAYDALRQEIVSFDAEDLGLDFALPTIFLQGELDALTVSVEVEQYTSRIRSPHKAYIGIAGGGHSPWVMREVYLDLLRHHVRPIVASA
jgi:pimeloyl-ACP methyl ester carboxylesterase